MLVTFFVVNSERLLELFLQSFLVLLNKKLGRKLTKFAEFKKT